MRVPTKSPTASARQPACVDTVTTPFGELTVLVTREGVLACTSKAHRTETLSYWSNRGYNCLPPAQALPAEKRMLQQAVNALRAYARGDASLLKRCPVVFTGTEFQSSVWKQLRTIPYGKVRTYQEIAQKVKNVAAVRAVGGACGANAALIFVPCHRVIASGTKRVEDRLGGFAGGLKLKRALLQHENSLVETKNETTKTIEAVRTASVYSPKKNAPRRSD